MSNCEYCSNIKYLESQDSGEYDWNIEDGIYKSEDGHFHWFANCADSWYSDFVHRVIYCPFCGRKIDEQE